MWQPQSFQPLSQTSWTPSSFQSLDNQTASQPPSQGQQPAPALADQNANNQGDLVQRASQWANSPTNVDLSNLPQSGQGLNFAQKLGFGAQALGIGLMGAGEDMIIKPAVRGITELMQGSAGQMRPATDNPLDPQRGNLSTDALGTLAMLSPTSVARPENMAPFNSGQQAPEPIGNQLIKYAGQPDSEKEQALSVLQDALTPTGKQPGSTLMAGMQARSPEQYQEAAGAVSDAANPLWKQMRQAGDALTPEASGGLMDNITKNLSSPENEYIPELNPKTTAIIKTMQAKADQGSLGVSTLDQYRRMLSRVGGSEDGFSAGMARRTIDQYLSNIPDKALASGNKDAIDLLNQARAQSAAGFKAQDVADIITKANGDPNRLKAGLTRFVSDEDNLAGMSQQQKDALRFAANTGIGENILKAFGKFGLDFSKSGTGNTVLPALMSLGKAGGAALVPGGIPAVMAATVMRQAQKYMARGSAEQAFRLFEQGAR